MNILITGGAGFIGSALAHQLLDRGDHILAIDNLNDYYEVSLKVNRLSRLESRENFRFSKMDITDRNAIERLFQENHFDAVMHLAAQAGVRYSIDNPYAYIDANLVGFGNILEGCRHNEVKHLVFASSSSVYGANTQLPFGENDAVDHPVSLYAATKKANELMAHTYAHLYDLPCTGLRFFTVYGPWGRPDMAFFKFTKLILDGKPIPIYNHGNLCRDFTYIDDIVSGIIKTIDHTASRNPQYNPDQPQSSTSQDPYQIFNIGNGSKVELMDYIQTLESCLGVKAHYDMQPMQDGDVKNTQADITSIQTQLGFEAKTDITQGLSHFVKWYREYYQT